MVTMAALAAARIADAHPVDDPMTGIASWYGEPHHGRLTANGEIFDQEALTAAHPSLPFGTILRVTNLHDGLSVEVRINDRGPVIPGRIVDLSRAAARSVRATGLGIFRVRLEVVPRETPTTAAMRDASARRTTTSPKP
ncbi:MAG: septal ring lytic transglycosylase RlpA family protein [Candidatus Rokubacteria bacterium]|nr:septal ring lytic transglycosylase RlpA family protein [Candidatus Rokubacteria bacterium]